MAVDYTVHDGVAVITLDNPPVNGLGLRRGSGSWKASSARATIASVTRHRDHGRRQGLLGRRRHHRIQHAESHAGADAAHRHQGGRRQREAGCRGDPQRRDGRRARTRARRALPRRRARRADRAARSEARHPAGRGRHAAPAARGRPRNRAQHDRLGRRRCCRRSSPTPALFDRTRRGRSARRRRSRSRARCGAQEGPHPKVRDRTIEHPNAAGLHPVRAQQRRGGREALPGAAQMHRRSRGGRAERLRPRPRVRARMLSSRSCRRPRAARCVTRSSASARRARFADVPADTPVRDIKRVGRDRRGHDGRRHRDELRQRGHSGHAAGNEAGRARPRRSRRSARTTKRGQEGQAHAGRARSSAWRCITPTLVLRRPGRRRPRSSKPCSKNSA